MKRLTILFCAIFAFIGLSMPAVAQEDSWAAVFSFNGFSELSVGDVNGGAGLRYGLTDAVSLRGTFGVSTKDPSTSALSGALLFDIGGRENTNAYLAPAFTYSHVDGEKAVWTFGGLFGVEYKAWDNIALGAEYGLTVKEVDGETDIGFGHSTGEILISVWF